MSEEVEQQNQETSKKQDTIDPDSNVYPVRELAIISVSLLILVFGSSYIPDLLDALSEKEQAEPVSTPIEPVETKINEVRVNPFEVLTITAHAAYVWDIREQRALFIKNADSQLPLASLTKLMTTLVAYELLDSDSSVDITLDAIYQDGESGLFDGESFSAQKLSDLTLITSSNDGAYALAAAAGATLLEEGGDANTFVEAMNVRAEQLGLSKTFFRNPTGLDISSSQAGAYGSAKDVAFLMEYILENRPEVLEMSTKEQTTIASKEGEIHLAENTNQTTLQIPGIIASKTGYTELAGGNLVIAFDAGLNHPIIVSVLSSTRSGRFRDALTLVEATRDYINNQ